MPEIVSVQERFGVDRTHWPETELGMSAEADCGVFRDSHRPHRRRVDRVLVCHVHHDTLLSKVGGLRRREGNEIDVLVAILTLQEFDLFIKLLDGRAILTQAVIARQRLVDGWIPSDVMLVRQVLTGVVSKHSRKMATVVALACGRVVRSGFMGHSRGWGATASARRYRLAG